MPEPSPSADEFAPRTLVSTAAGRGENVRAHWDTDADDEPDLGEWDEYAEYAERVEAERDAAAAQAPTGGPDTRGQDTRGQDTRGQDFVHLHVHSEYSLLDGLSSVKQLIAETKRHGMRALALTDHGNLYGALDFYTYAREAGINPILGVEAYVSPRGMTDRGGAQDRAYYHLVLLAKDREGYSNLLKLVTRANLEGYYYKPRIDRATLAEHARGLIALSACYSGEPSRAILDGDPKKAREAAGWYREVFGEDYFLELQQHGNADDEVVNRGLLEIHRDLGIPYVATNDLHYARQSDAAAQDILLCVQTNSAVDDPKRSMRMDPERAPYYLKSPAEMWEAFRETPLALTNTLAIAERCNLTLEFNRLNFPALDHLVPPGQTPLEFLVRTCRERLAQRYGARLSDAHRERLEYELGVIEQTGFASYILFVWDFVEWARKQGILCGPRGSAAGSIILYALGISDVDPVGYGLTFERFLNPERIQMPDIDMDFPDDRRGEVIEYVVNRYGRERVAQIVTFGRLLARAAIRDVGRALGYPLNEVDRVAKLVPSIPIGLKIDQAIEQNPELKQAYEADPAIKKLIDTARSVEGVARHAGTHAAGVVVADQPLVNYVPLQKPTKGEGQMTQYSMKGLEKIGLLKMDFLGLANLTMLAKALENLRQTRSLELDLNTLPENDPLTYQMLSRGETKTVFQLEGSGMTRYIQDLKPSNVDHLAAMVALYRPGPMAHIPSYIARREGREPPTPPDLSLEDLLRESYGIIVYQDQVLQVVRKVAGYSLGQADVLRRAMGKKDKDEMAREGPKFIKAALEHGYSRATAEHLWELLQPFSGYAFNRAHAYCYAFLAYQTAYLKANYPVEWFAAVLSTIAQDSDKVVSVVGECRRLGVEVLRPSINKSRSAFVVEHAPNPANPLQMQLGIRYGLCAVKNVGEGAVEHIVAERDQRGPFRGLDDLCRRVDLHTANKRVLESLIKCGALDDFGAAREALLKGLDAAMGLAQKEQKAASTGQSSLFEAFGAAGGPPSPDSAAGAGMASVFTLPAVPPVAPRERAAWEKEVLGFHFADHPFQEAAAWLASEVTHTTAALSPELNGEKVKVAGAVTGVRKITTKIRGQMAVLTLEDLHGAVEVVVFPRSYEKSPDLWREDVILVVDGKVDVRDEKVQLILDSARLWEPPAAGTPPPAPVSTPIVGATASEAAPAAANGSAHEGRNGYTPSATAPAAANGHSANGHAANGTRHGQAAEPGPANGRVARLLTVVVPRGPDDEACKQVLAQVHSLLLRHPGDDHLRLVLQARDGARVELAGVAVTTGLTPDLESHLRTLVGDENVAASTLAAST